MKQIKLNSIVEKDGHKFILESWVEKGLYNMGIKWPDERRYSYNSFKKNINYRGFTITFNICLSADGEENVYESNIYIKKHSNFTSKQFASLDEAKQAIDKLHEIMHKRYKNSENRITEMTISKNKISRGKFDEFMQKPLEDILESLCINGVTSINEYKEIGFATIYSLIRDSKEENKEWAYEMLAYCIICNN